MGPCWLTEMETCSDTLRFEREKGKKKKRRIRFAKENSESGVSKMKGEWTTLRCPRCCGLDFLKMENTAAVCPTHTIPRGDRVS